MPNPRLLNAVPVFLRQIVRSQTDQDDSARAPKGQAYRSHKIRLIAQVKIGDTDMPAASPGGVIETSAGYLLFLTADLKRDRVTINRGDRVVKIGLGDAQRDTDYYITKMQWRGHYAGPQGPTLLKAFFSDRKPSRQRGDL